MGVDVDVGVEVGEMGKVGEAGEAWKLVGLLHRQIQLAQVIVD